jgi:hypothetical protein
VGKEGERNWRLFPAGSSIVKSVLATARGLLAGLIIGAVSFVSAQSPAPRAALELTLYGARSGFDLGASLQNAINDCASLGVPVHVAAGNYLVNAQSAAAWPTQNNACPGIFGDGPDASWFVPVDYNGPVISIVVQAGVIQSGKYIHDLGVAASWSSSSLACDNARLFSITGASDGFAYSKFTNLRGYAVHDIVFINTAAIATSGYIQSNSGWNDFNSFWGNSGVPCTRTPGTGGSPIVSGYPDSLVNYGGSTSTGNTFTTFSGAVDTALVYSAGGADSGGNLFMVGDLVFNGGQLGKGRVLYVGGGATCPGYFRTITITNIQVDAGSTELAGASCGSIRNLKAWGNFGGSGPWTGLNYLQRSTINDLGASEWKVGGPILTNGTATAHTIPLWRVTFGPGGSRISVSVAGTVGGVDSGVAGATFECAYNGSSGNTNCRQIGATSATTASGTVSANFPTFSSSSSGSQVTFSTTFTDTTTATVLDAFAVSQGGSLKIQRLAPVGSLSPANPGVEGIVY